MANVCTVVRCAQAQHTIAALSGLRRREHMTTELVVLSLQGEGRHLDIVCMLGDGDVVIVVLDTCISEHPREYLLVYDLHTLPVVGQDMLIVGVVLLAKVGLHERQLILAKVFV